MAAIETHGCFDMNAKMAPRSHRPANLGKRAEIHSTSDQIRHSGERQGSSLPLGTSFASEEEIPAPNVILSVDAGSRADYQ
jgi:hypothetical protein